MPFLSSRDGAAVRDVAAALASNGERAPVPFSEAFEMLREMVRSPSGTKFSFHRRGQGLGIEHGESNGEFPRDGLLEFDGWLADKLVGWTLYNPLSPEPAQRNVAVAFDARDVWRNPPAVARELFPRWGLRGFGSLRILLCDGPTLIGHVSYYRREVYSPREVRILRSLARPMRERLLLDEMVAHYRLRHR